MWYSKTGHIRMKLKVKLSTDSESVIPDLNCSVSLILERQNIFSKKRLDLGMCFTRSIL